MMGKCDFISSEGGAERCFGDLEFPASKQDILKRIEESEGAEAAIVAANQLPDKTYESMGELLESLAE